MNWIRKLLASEETAYWLQIILVLAVIVFALCTPFEIVEWPKWPH